MDTGRLGYTRSCVHEILESGYHLDFNTVEKVLDHYFSKDFLPQWYFHANSPAEIASHVYSITQLLTAQNPYLTEVSSDGRAITYILNVGRDYPGRLEGILQQNVAMGIGSFDAVRTRSGIGIITLEKRGRRHIATGRVEPAAAEALFADARAYGSAEGHRHTEEFLHCLTPEYILEEVASTAVPPRIRRHQSLFERAVETEGPVIIVEATDKERPGDNERLTSGETRVAVALKNPPRDFAIDGVAMFTRHGINIRRAYQDTFLPCAENDHEIGLLSIYVDNTAPTDAVVEDLRELRPRVPGPPERTTITVVEEAIRSISRLDAEEGEVADALKTLRTIAAANGDTSAQEEIGVFLLNSLTDFFDAAEGLGIADNNAVMRMLLRFEAFEEFWVEHNEGRSSRHLPAFRTRHNTARGTAKGGLRIDPIVEFVEVSALSFMMTWKCARSRILFGGGKGGLKTTPDYYKSDKIDTFDTLANFGRALFLVTGPFRDVPAGDVGCGPQEVGNMFEGFKSALRDLALMAYGVKHGATLFGNRVVSATEARHILRDGFGIDYQDRKAMRELVFSERYLELVAAAHITGKPFMGIAARGGATGRGLLYSLLAVVTRLHLDGRWESAEALSGAEEELLGRVAAYTEDAIRAGGGAPVVPEERWRESSPYRKLLTGRRVVIQGSGKVGGSLLAELEQFDVNLIAIADKDGAILGDRIPISELLAHLRKTGSVVGFQTNVTRTIHGGSEATEILELPCDILVPAALENAITARNAPRIEAHVVLCGANGPNTSKAERILFERGVVVVYDFLANGAGVIASYFEWLRNLAQRLAYEAETIRHEGFSFDSMDPYIMPEFRRRIKEALRETEGEGVTAKWNALIRDIMFSAVNDDYNAGRAQGISMKIAGYRSAIARVLVALLLKQDAPERAARWPTISETTRAYLEPYFAHPEAALFHESPEELYRELQDAALR